MRATKLWLAFVAASLVSMGAMAQGIHVGYVQSRFSTAIGDGAPSKSEAMNGFEAGFDQTFKIAKGIIAVDYGLNYTYLASEAASAEAGDLMSVSGRMKNHYLDIPVHLQIGVPILGVVRVFAYGGPKFIVGLSSKTTVDMDVAGTSTTVTYNHYNGKVTAPGLSDDELGNASGRHGHFQTLRHHDGRGRRRGTVQAPHREGRLRMGTDEPIEGRRHDHQPQPVRGVRRAVVLKRFGRMPMARIARVNANRSAFVRAIRVVCIPPRRVPFSSF